MAAEHRQQVERLVRAALERDASKRSDFLDGACLDDGSLRQEVEAVLAFRDRSASSLESHSTSVIAVREDATSLEGRKIGPYKLLREIGEGGMGIVYEAEQEEPVRRKVALKLIKWGMDTKQVIARFESERQALALMNHPNIASVYDAGATEEGRPFFAMEYVQGIPITQYCDKHRLTIKERLGLFIQVCEGVQHAHQKGIIHRNIKPSNVLVAVQDDKPVPKIIDFGVAKATSQRLTEHTVATELGQLIGTPEYMSPEQAEMTNLDIDTRTDVYSLGVLIYELLVGALPFDLKELREAGLAEIQKKLREDEPPRPSTRVSSLGEASTTSASNRQVDVRALQRQLRGDLDWITMKALEKDRTRRYETANALARDVRRFLDNDPVRARAPSGSYRLRKFIRRHKVGVSAGTGIGLALVLGLVLALLGMMQARAAERRAESEASAATEIADFLVGLFQVADPSEARGSNVTAREILDAGASDVQRVLADQPEVQARLLGTIGRVYTGMGLYGEAVPLLEQAAAIQGKLLGEEHVETLRTVNNLANTYWYQDRPEKAEALYSRVVRARERILGQTHPETLRAKFDLASAYHLLGRYDDAVRITSEVLAVQRDVHGENHRDTLATLHNLASMYMYQNRYEEAEPLQREVVERRINVLGDDHPDTLNSMSTLARILNRLGHHKEAETLCTEAISTMRTVLGSEHMVTLNATKNLAKIQLSLARYEEAEKTILTAYRGLVSALGDGHDRTMEATRVFVELYEAWGKPEKAAEYRALLTKGEDTDQ